MGSDRTTPRLHLARPGLSEERSAHKPPHTQAGPGGTTERRVSSILTGMGKGVCMCVCGGGGGEWSEVMGSVDLSLFSVGYHSDRQPTRAQVSKVAQESWRW